MRERVHGRAARQALGQILHDRHLVRRARCRGGSVLPLGRHVPRTRLEWASGHGALHAASRRWARVRMEERRNGMGTVTETRVIEGSETGFATTKFEALLNWAMKYS